MNGILTAQVLRAGVTVSFLLVVAGLIVSLSTAPQQANLQPSEVSATAAGSFSWGRSLVHAGLLALLATPFIRLVTVTADLARARNFSFAILSLGVILILTFSVLIGWA